MKNQIIIIITIITVALSPIALMTSCKKSSGSSNDSATFLFHMHTQIVDSTIGGNPGPDSNTTGSNNVWFQDSMGRRIELLVPQFYITGIQLVNANGSIYNMTKAVLLKGLDSEDYYVGKAPVGTYISANFTVGINNADSTVAPSTLFKTDQNYFPLEASMWNGTDYYGMVIQGLYDTSSAGEAGLTPVNPIPFNLQLPNSVTTAYKIVLPTRGTRGYGVYVASAGSTNYVHLYCDYGKLLTAINLKTSNQTSANPLIADSLASKLPDMFRYEQ